MVGFNKWLDKFVEEKKINLEKAFEFINEKGIWNYMPVSVVIDFVKQLSSEEKNKIKTTIVKIDFYNGNVYHFFEYLAKGISLV